MSDHICVSSISGWRSALPDWRLGGGVFLALSLLGSSAMGQDRDTLTGDWNGRRTDWEEHGITVRGDYVSESFDIVRGGLRQGARYAQQLRVGADFDMRKLVGWSSGTFHLTLNDRAGRGVSTDLAGNRLPIQEVYSSQFAKLTELSYDQDVLDHRGNIKLGIYAMGNDFGGLTLLCEFVNAAFCAHPLAMSGGSGWGNYPNARWGVRFKYDFTPHVQLRVGTFQVDPAYSTEAHAFSLHPSGSTGALIPLELDLHTPAGKSAYPGELKLGAYYDTSAAVREGSSGEVNGRHGVYLLGTQKVYDEQSNSARGLTVAGELMKADNTTAQITYWYSLDAIYQGTFPGRDQDTVGIGYVRAVVNHRLVQAYRDEHLDADSVEDAFLDTLPNAESVIELSYGWRPTRWSLVRPDVQWVVDPGAFSYRHTPSVLALGVQLKATF